MRQLLIILLALMVLTILLLSRSFKPTDRELEHQHCDSLCECDGLGCDDDMHHCMEYEDPTENPD